jgi:DNA-binding IclR family transcriptional regulator
MPKINARERNEEIVKQAILEWLKVKPYSPSFRDLVKNTGLSLGTVHSACRDLREKKVINYLDGVARTIRIVNE